MINLGEVLYCVERRHGFAAAQKTLMLSQSLPIKILEVTNDLGLEAAHIKANHPLSYSDAFTVAVAINQKAIVLTGDPEFESVETLVNVEWLNRQELLLLPKNRIPTHPGEILLEEFLNPLGLSQVAFAIC